MKFFAGQGRFLSRRALLGLWLQYCGSWETLCIERVFTTNQITWALVAYRSAADQDTATASSIAAALLSYYTVAQVDGLLPASDSRRRLGAANSRAVRFPDDSQVAGSSALLSSFEASSAVTRSSRDWMAAALLLEAAVFTARSVT